MTDWINTDAVQMLRMQEGDGPVRNRRFFAYDDATGKELKPGDILIGNLTIANGRNLTAKGISDGLALLYEDIGDAFEVIHHNFTDACFDGLSRPRQLVLISMAYNLGPKLSKWTRFIGQVHLGCWEGAALEIEDSDSYRGVTHERYKELARMMRDNTSQWI